MQKRILTALLALIFIFTFASCGKEEKPATPDIISEYYSRRGVHGWMDAAAVSLIGMDASPLVTDYPDCSEELEKKAECLIMHALLGTKCGTDHTAECARAVEKEYKDIPVVTLCKCAFGLELAGIKYDKKPAAAYLEKLQLDSGAFPTASDYAADDVMATAYALEAIMLWRDDISDNCFDSAVIYLSREFTDHNLIKYGRGESASASASVLRSLIHAGIPLDGDISQAMQEAFDVVYKVELAGKILGYKEYEKDESYSTSSSSEIMYALAVTCYGSIFKE